MQILVNQEPLSYTLESENSLGEVVDGVASWLQSEQFAITAIELDDTLLPIHNRSAWDETALDTVETLSIEALPLEHVRLTTLEALAEYCGLFDTALAQNETGSIVELSREIPYVRARVAELLPALAGDGEHVLPETSLDRGEVPGPEEVSAFRSRLAGLLTVIEARLREYRDPVRELMLCLGQLTGVKDSLEDVPIQLQTGKESVAMTTVVRFAELLSRIIRILPLVPEDAGVDTQRVHDFAVDLTPILAQLQEAFEAQDTVLLGDLLEYEVAPRLATASQLVPSDVVDEETGNT